MEITHDNSVKVWQDKSVQHIHVPQDACAEVRIMLDDASTATGQSCILIHAEKNSELTIIENIKGSDCSYDVQIIAEEGANVRYVSMQQLDKQATGIFQRTARLQDNARITWVECHSGGKSENVITKTFLEGEGAESRQYSMFMSTDEQAFNADTQTIHCKSRTTSRMITKASLAGKSKAVYRGLVRIERNACKCEGYQKEDSLLLSEQAKADSVPCLEINNNDVKCSHGATVCQPDKEKIFYLMSRGLTEEDAKKSIVKGFFEPVLQEINDEIIVNKIRKSISTL